MTKFDRDLAQYQWLFGNAFEKVLPDFLRTTGLYEPMKYAIRYGGKRLRPIVCLASAVAVGGKPEDALCPAMAIELLHNYTLIHDDLPAMDNDTERRGEPSVWAKFGEAQGILAGDALQALAFQVAARSPRNVAKIVGVLGEKGVGVAAGQSNEERWRETAEADSGIFIYLHKTADLFVAAAKMGALAGGGKASELAALEAYAVNLGLAFQFEDDLLDGDGLFTVNETMRRVKEHTRAALAALKPLPGDTSFLAALARRLTKRTV